MVKFISLGYCVPFDSSQVRPLSDPTSNITRGGTRVQVCWGETVPL
uniref:Uncharacterized protein n=1 Tax=Arundo donax TaxID=35708 RepID=A0A0A9BIR3_ARUDO